MYLSTSGIFSLQRGITNYISVFHFTVAWLHVSSEREGMTDQPTTSPWNNSDSLSVIIDSLFPAKLYLWITVINSDFHWDKKNSSSHEHFKKITLIASNCKSEISCHVIHCVTLYLNVFLNLCPMHISEFGVGRKVSWVQVVRGTGFFFSGCQVAHAAFIERHRKVL